MFTVNRNPDFARLESDWGIHLMATDWLPEDRAAAIQAMDAQPGLVTVGSAGIPAMMTTYVDPEVVRVLQAPNQGADILGEQKTGDWTTTTAMFPVVENTGTVSAYSDRNVNGRSDANATFPQRQSFHFQTMIGVGDREAAMAGAARLNWIQEKQVSAAKTLDKFMDYIYHNGVSGLQNYGLLNDPALPAALTPSTKVAGGVTWNTATGAPNAQAMEIYNDIQTLATNLFINSKGIITAKTRMTLAMAPQSEGALLATNQFGYSVYDLIKKAYPNMTTKTSARYATAGGNLVQLIADEFDGAKTGYCAFTEKLRDHPVVRQASSWEQKKTSGAWGAIIRYPIAIAQMLGV
jgi:hypothetical protein